MNYYCVCKCGATCWARGREEYDTNATEITGKQDWSGGQRDCPHDEYTIEDSESDDDV